MLLLLVVAAAVAVVVVLNCINYSVVSKVQFGQEEDLC